MCNLLVFASPPASGKTTLSHELATQYHAIRLSFDEMRCFKHSELIVPILKALNDGEPVIVDALYTETQWREELLAAVKHINCKKICVCLTTPLEECLRRNAQRKSGARLPDFIVKDIYKRFEPPTLDEGWDEIIWR